MSVILPLDPKDPRRTVVEDLWRALERDDDEAIPALFVPYQLEKITEPGPGVAARLREAFGRSRVDCARMDNLGMVPFDDDPDACVVGSQRRDLGQNMLVPVALVSMLIVARWSGDKWLIYGEPSTFEGGAVLTGHGLPT